MGLGSGVGSGGSLDAGGLVLVGLGFGLLVLVAFGFGLAVDFVGVGVEPCAADADGFGRCLAVLLAVGLGLFDGLGAAVGLVAGGVRPDADGSGASDP